MARLVAIGILLWAVYASIAYSIENFPKPAEAVETAAQPSPVEVIAEVEASPEPLPEPDPGTPAFFAGAYAIGDSSDPEVAARDRDYRPRRQLFVTDERARESSDDDDDDDRDRDDDDRDRDDDDRDRDDDDRDRDDEDEEPRDPYVVEGEIEPGLYATAFGTTDCRFELWRVMRDRNTRIIGEEQLSDGRLLVTIDEVEPDWFTSSDDCGDWYRWQPMSAPLTEAGDGDYWVGDLSLGVWFVPEPCRWEKVVAFRGARLADVADGGSGPGSLTIDDETLGVRLRSCRSPISLTSPQSNVYAP